MRGRRKRGGQVHKKVSLSLADAGLSSQKTLSMKGAERGEGVGKKGEGRGEGGAER